mmetsp:Transcript_1418/g.2956  ORF Transcript_1418/g.2956 Transcript_1418/m.2956 type:complete len:598 (-) Transcript_1418:167-1960(-)
MGAGCTWRRHGAAYELHEGYARPSPTVAELKGRLKELGLDLPSDVVEKSELVALVNEAEKRKQHVIVQQSPVRPASPPPPSSPGSSSGAVCMGSPSGGRQSVAALKARLRELGFSVPTSIVEKSELMDIVQEAERQAAKKAEATASVSTPGPTSPSASHKPLSTDSLSKLKGRLHDLGVEVPEQTLDELELLIMLKNAEQHEPSIEIEQPMKQSVVKSVRGQQGGVSHLQVCDKEAHEMGTFMSAEGAIKGVNFTWVRGESIGQGSSGNVFKALNQATGEIMAVKEVHFDPQRRSDAKFKAQLEGEITIMRELRHANIVSYYGSDVIGNNLYMYIEYMAGGSMSHVLNQFGAFEESLISDYSKQLLNGLEYLHTRDPYVVHRDIKGANVLVGLDHDVKLADFGCSKREKETITQTIAGSIPWMAPEVIAHARYGRKADIWSFGCLMIEMATAECPWGSFDNLMAAMIKIGMSMEMPPIPEELSRKCRGFIMRCLQREPRKRLTATDLLKEDFMREPGDDSVQEPLPEGWEKHFDPAHNEWFYWNGDSNTASWERPVEEGDEEDESDEEDEEEDDDEEDEDDDQTEDDEQNASQFTLH